MRWRLCSGTSPALAVRYVLRHRDGSSPFTVETRWRPAPRYGFSDFELDFEENLRIVKMAAKYGKRVVFPSTSEVYGMCPDREFDEDSSPLVYGPIRKERWIYSASKQLLDRVIWAMGNANGLRFTLFRPFNLSLIHI